jgi:hypothetical protein
MGPQKGPLLLRIFVRRSNDVRYFTDDLARELDGLRAGGPGWWLRGRGDTRDPQDVERVLQTSPRSSVFGYDMVIAAPRPLSIIMAIDPASAPGVIQAHRESVRATVEYLEDHALVVRDQRDGGDRDLAGRWQAVVSYTHGLNRHGEPHLHDHVLVGAKPHESTNVLDSRALFAHVPAGDALYRSSLRYELAKRTKWSAWRSFDSVEHVRGLDEGYRSLWGGHHHDRGEKLHWARDQTVDQWSRDLERWEPELKVVAPPRAPGFIDEHAFGAALEGRTEVARRHVVEAWANAATFGTSGSDLQVAVDDLYPKMVGARGVHELTIGVGEARMTSQVRDRGPRPLDIVGLRLWRQRERELDQSRSERSR